MTKNKLMALAVVGVASFAPLAMALEKNVDVDLLRLEQNQQKLQVVNEQALKDLKNEMELKFVRMEQTIGKLQAFRDQAMIDMRKLEKENDFLRKQGELVTDIVDKSNKDLLKMANENLPDLEQQIKAAQAEAKVHDWGERERDCGEYGVHQQIKLMTKDDMAMRVLCFDGKLLHLGTEQFTPPQ